MGRKTETSPASACVPPWCRVSRWEGAQAAAAGPKAPRPVAGALLPPGVRWWNRRLCQERLTGSFPSLLFRPRVHLLQQPQRVEARVVVGPDRGMSLPPSLGVGWRWLPSGAGGQALPRQAGDPREGSRDRRFLARFAPPRQRPSQPGPFTIGLLGGTVVRLLPREEIPQL